MKLPKARTENLLEQNLEKETLIYDLITNKAFNLNETSTAVYKACGHNQTFEDLKREHNFSDDFIYLALDELKRNNLLIGEYRSPLESRNRRELIKKVGLASMLALPIITGLIAPKAVNAASNMANSPGGVDLSKDGLYGERCATCEYGPCCYGGYICVGSTRRDYTCCNPGSGGNNRRMFPGESTSVYNTSPRYLNIGSVPDSTDLCRSEAACCDGSAATGICYYEPDTLNEYSEQELAELARDNKAAYLTRCTCSC